MFKNEKSCHFKDLKDYLVHIIDITDVVSLLARNCEKSGLVTDLRYSLVPILEITPLIDRASLTDRISLTNRL